MPRVLKASRRVMILSFLGTLIVMGFMIRKVLQRNRDTDRIFSDRAYILRRFNDRLDRIEKSNGTYRYDPTLDRHIKSLSISPTD